MTADTLERLRDAANTLTAYCSCGGGRLACYVCHAQSVMREVADELADLMRPGGVPQPETKGAENLDGTLTLRFLQYINAKRAARWHAGGITDWSALEWAGAMAGEAGEACNAAKKLKRVEDGIANINHEEGRSLTDRENACAAVVKEVADIIIYGVLLAERVGFDIEEAVRMAFNRKSEEYNFPERIGVRPGGVETHE